jgi:uncharacterized protein YraI
MKLKSVFVAAMLLTPTAALAAPGIITASIGMRAGPGPGFPTVDRIPGGAHVNIHGCLRGDAWCDVSWSGDRGWVSSQYLEYLYRNHYVDLNDYAHVIDVPVVPFVLSSYWSSYYPSRPWYHRRAYWSSYWRSHARFATRAPIDRSSRLGRAQARTAVNEEQTRSGVMPGRQMRGAEAAQRRVQAHVQPHIQARMAHVNGANRAFFRTQQRQIARGHQATRFSAAPAARPAFAAHIAQPSAGRRFGGSPMNARAQMAAPRAAPAIPHIGGGGQPRINAAPHIGGGHAGGPAGHPHH